MLSPPGVLCHFADRDRDGLLAIEDFIPLYKHLSRARRAFRRQDHHCNGQIDRWVGHAAWDWWPCLQGFTAVLKQGTNYAAAPLLSGCGAVLRAFTAGEQCIAVGRHCCCMKCTLLLLLTEWLAACLCRCNPGCYGCCCCCPSFRYDFYQVLRELELDGGQQGLQALADAAFG